MTDRRQFLGRGALCLGGVLAADTWLARRALAGDPVDPAVTVGLLTDVHHADKPPRNTRHYRDSLAKVNAVVESFNGAGDDPPVDLAVHLGDLIDAAGSEVTDEVIATELGYLDQIEQAYARCTMERHYVFGNHCVDTLTKPEFAERTGATGSYYSFDRAGVHFVVLDACFTGDGLDYARKNFHWTDANIPEHELRWLEADLAAAGAPTVVLTHQRLDDADRYSIRNANAVRRVLEASGKVAAVFQGHSHENSLAEIAGIHYCVVRAVIEGPGAENNASARVSVFPDGSMLVRGHKAQTTHRLGSG